MDDNIGETWGKLFMGCSQNCLNRKEYSHMIIYYIPNVPSPIFDKYMNISTHLELHKLLSYLGMPHPVILSKNLSKWNRLIWIVGKYVEGQEQCLLICRFVQHM